MEAQGLAALSHNLHYLAGIAAELSDCRPVTAVHDLMVIPRWLADELAHIVTQLIVAHNDAPSPDGPRILH